MFIFEKVRVATILSITRNDREQILRVSVLETTWEAQRTEKELPGWASPEAALPSLLPALEHGRKSLLSPALCCAIVGVSSNGVICQPRSNFLWILFKCQLINYSKYTYFFLMLNLFSGTAISNIFCKSLLFNQLVGKLIQNYNSLASDALMSNNSLLSYLEESRLCCYGVSALSFNAFCHKH